MPFGFLPLGGLCLLLVEGVLGTGVASCWVESWELAEAGCLGWVAFLEGLLLVDATLLGEGLLGGSLGVPLLCLEALLCLAGLDPWLVSLPSAGGDLREELLVLGPAWLWWGGEVWVVGPGVSLLGLGLTVGSPWGTAACGGVPSLGATVGVACL